LRVHYGGDLAHERKVYPKMNGAEKDRALARPYFFVGQKLPPQAVAM